MKRIDVNCDMGESFGTYTLGMDGEVLRYIHSANIACGYHADDRGVMDRTVKAARECGVAAGAHPGFALCVHGDNPSALHHAHTIREALEAQGTHIAAPGASA